MEKASKVMYTIANIFNWIIAGLSVLLIIFSILAIAKVLPAESAQGLGAGSLVYSILTLLVALAAIILVRIAKADRSSKAWDILFIVIGVVGGNVFYILGGIFGLVARR